MATITFENGKSVKFEGNPTPEDIDFVAQQIGITPKKSEPALTDKGFGSLPVAKQLTQAGIGIGSAIGRGVAGIPEGISRLFGAGAGALGLDKLSESYKENAEKIKSAKNKVFVEPFQKELESGFGQFGQAVGNIAPYFAGAGVINPLTAGMKFIPKVAARTALDIATSAAQSGGDAKTIGATTIPSIVGNAVFANTGKTVATLKDLLKTTSKSALTGYTSDVSSGMAGLRGEDREGKKAFIPGMGTALGTGLGLTTGGAQLAKNRFNPDPELINLTRKQIADTYERTLNLTPSQKAKEKMLLTKTGDNTFTTLTKHNINLGSEDAIKQLDDVLELHSSAATNAQQNERAFFNLSKTIKNTFKNIDEYAPSETSALAAKNKTQKELNLLMGKNPEAFIKDVNGDLKIQSDFIEKIRKTGNSWANYNKLTDPDSVSRTAGFALADAVRDTVEKEGSFPTYRTMMKEWGKLIHAKQVLTGLESTGKNQFKALGGLSGSVARKILSGTIGYSTGGLGGLVMGEIGSEYSARILSNPKLRTFMDRLLIKNANKKQTTELITKLGNEVKEYIEKQANVKLLPSASYIPTGAKTQTPEGARMVPAAKNPVTVNPKTGKFQTTYSLSSVDNPPITQANKIPIKSNAISPTISQSKSNVNITKSGKVDIDTVLGDVKNNVKMVTESGGKIYGFENAKAFQNSPQYSSILEHVKTDAMQALVDANVPIPPLLKTMKVTGANVKNIPTIVEKAIKEVLKK